MDDPYQVSMSDDFEDSAEFEILHEMLLRHSLHLCQKELVTGGEKLFRVILNVGHLSVKDTDFIMVTFASVILPIRNYVFRSATSTALTLQSKYYLISVNEAENFFETLNGDVR